MGLFQRALETYDAMAHLVGVEQEALQGGNGAFHRHRPGRDADGLQQQGLFAGKFHS